jgi:DNA-binding NtrC family response regulator
VKQNGGEILVYSEPSQGTVFKIYIPAVTRESAQSLPAEDKDVAEPSTGAIVLVEDEDQVRNLTRAILTRQGYRVFDFASAVDALAFLRGQSEGIDLLISDIVMPNMGGLELAREAQAMRPGIRVLMMSGYTETAVSGQGLITPGTVFIHKPFTAASLRAKVVEALG